MTGFKTFAFRVLAYGLGAGIVFTTYAAVRDTWNAVQDETGLIQAMNLENRRDDIRVLVLGDSMTAMSVRPDGTDVFNFASPGDTLVEIEDKLRFALPRLANLKSVIIQFNTNLFSRAPEEIIPHSRFEKIPSWNGRQDVACVLRGCCKDPTAWTELKCTLNTVRGKIVASYSRIGGSPHVEPNGFVEFPEGRKWIIHPKTPQTTTLADIHHNTGRWIESYKRILNTIAAGGQLVVLYMPPLDAQYRTALADIGITDEPQYLAAAGLIERPTYLCSADDVGLKRTDFFNSGHLAPSAATQYTSSLKNCLDVARQGIHPVVDGQSGPDKFVVVSGARQASKIAIGR